MMAEVLHFYPGISWDALLDMDGRWFYKLYARIPRVEARRLLSMLDVVSYPHMADRNARRRIVHTLEQRAGYKEMQHLANIDPKRRDDAWARLRALGRPSGAVQQQKGT